MSAHIVARDQLRSFIERIERLEAEKKTIADDIKDVYGEAKAIGFDAKILRKVISIRKQDADERAEQEAILDTYLQALGMIQTDLFDEPEPETSPKLVASVATAMQTQSGRAALLTAVDIMIEREERQEPDGGAIAAVKGKARLANADGVEPSPSEHIDPITGEITEIATNEGGEDVESSAERAGPEGPFSIEPSGPEAERATNSPDTAQTHSADMRAEGREVGTAASLRDQAGDCLGYEATPPRPMKSLPYASCFPELTKSEYGRLEFSIIGIGVSKPIIRMGDVIVDGWNRYNISRSLGIRYPVEEYSGNDVLLDVIAWQREARQFTPTQERQIASRLAKEIPHRAADIMAAFSLTEAAEKEMA